MAASDGSQLTDFYGSALPGYQVGPMVGSVVFPFTGRLVGGVLTVDMGDFQTDQVGRPIGSVDFNGVPQDWSFSDGFGVTVVREFDLDLAVVEAANSGGRLVVNIARSGSSDFLAFDYFAFDGQLWEGSPEPVPEPGSAAGLLAIALGFLLGSAARRVRRARAPAAACKAGG
jgi:hypothetical protein